MKRRFALVLAVVLFLSLALPMYALAYFDVRVGIVGYHEPMPGHFVANDIIKANHIEYDTSTTVASLFSDLAALDYSWMTAAEWYVYFSTSVHITLLGIGSVDPTDTYQTAGINDNTHNLFDIVVGSPYIRHPVPVPVPSTDADSPISYSINPWDTYERAKIGNCKQWVNVRSGPGTEYEAIGLAYLDEIIALYMWNEDETWCNVVYAGGDRMGWVHSKFIILEKR